MIIKQKLVENNFVMCKFLLSKISICEHDNTADMLDMKIQGMEERTVTYMYIMTISEVPFIFYTKI